MLKVVNRRFCWVFFTMTICVLPFCNVLFAQLDTIQWLKEVEVTAERIDLTDIGKHTDQIDSNILSVKHYQNLASVLAMETPLYVRSYGAGTLSTLGIRGGSAAHTQILWNGIPIRNPMVGLQDLSLIPASLFDQASIHYGGHGAAFGSGAVGGLISILNSPVSSSNGLSLHLGGGSWGLKVGEIKLDYGFKALRLSSRLFSHQAENNYRYKLGPDLPERNQVHNEIKNQGFLQEATYTLNEKQWLTGRLWFQYADRQIPPTSTQNVSQAAQQDKLLRTSLQWNYAGQKFHWQLKSAWLDETVDFQDTMILLYTHNRFQTWLAEGETSFDLNESISVAGGVYTEISTGASENYIDEISRSQSAIYSSIRFIVKDWLWRFQARQEVTDGAWSPLLLDLSTEWYVVKQLTLKTSLSKNYRVPTLNDLHWRPGGNPDLVPEEGWTAEAGVHYKYSKQNFNITASLTGYNRNIDQWIMWMPPVKDLREYWSPINIAEVRSRGLETRASQGWPIGQCNFIVNGGLDLTWSTFETSIPEFQIEEGEQLFYVPVENVVAGINMQFRRLTGYYQHHWFGPSSGINDQIKAANIGSAGISAGFEMRKVRGSLYLQADNVWNVPYRMVERRPMPGRSFSGGVKFSI